MTELHLITTGDFALRVKHFAELGLSIHEIARMLNLPETTVAVILRSVDSREQHTTSNS